MTNENWLEVKEKLHGLFKEATVDFNEESTYCLMRRYKPELPFSFERYIKMYKEERNLNFVERRTILGDIFMALEEEKKMELINFILYSFHKRRVNKRKVIELEEYLDNNR